MMLKATHFNFQIYVTEVINFSSRVSPSSPSIQSQQSQALEESDTNSQQPVGNLKSSFHKAWKVTKCYYAKLLSGLLFATFLNEVLKTLVAEPRPHFLDTCRPIGLNCSQPGQFIPYYQVNCSLINSPRNGVPRAISDAMKSFPSGHAQLSTFAAVFMVVSRGPCSYFTCVLPNFVFQPH